MSKPPPLNSTSPQSPSLQVWWSSGRVAGDRVPHLALVEQIRAPLREMPHSRAPDDCEPMDSKRRAHGGHELDSAHHEKGQSGTNPPRFDALKLTAKDSKTCLRLPSILSHELLRAVAGTKWCRGHRAWDPRVCLATNFRVGIFVAARVNCNIQLRVAVSLLSMPVELRTNGLQTNFAQRDVCTFKDVGQKGSRPQPVT